MGNRLRCLERLEPRRLLAADLDYTFGVAGQAKFDLGERVHVEATALQADGKILIAGNVGDDAFVTRLNTNGSRDDSFGSAGVVTINVADGDVIRGLIVLPDGKILAGGTAGPLLTQLFGDPYLDPSRSFSLLVRLRADGHVDTASGFGGTRGMILGTPGDGGIEGMTLAGGKLFTTGGQQVRRHVLASGALDLTFGKSARGFVNVVDATELSQFYGDKIDVAPDGSVALLAGGVPEDSYDERDVGGQFSADNDCVVLLDAAGAPINSFDGNGVRFLGAGTSGGIHFSKDGRSIFVTDVGNDHGSPYPARLYRIARDGNWTIREAAPFTLSEPVDLAVAGDGKVYVASAGYDGAYVCRFNADGTPDKTYSNDGVATAEGYFDSGAVALDAAGRAVLATVKQSDYPRGGRVDVLRFLAAPTGSGITSQLKSDGTLLVTGTIADDRVDITYNSYDSDFREDVLVVVADHTTFNYDATAVSKIKKIQIVLLGGDDVVTNTEPYRLSTIPELIDGGDGDDRLDDGSGSGTVLGGAGDDWIGNSFGDDVLSGGDGTDTFQYWNNNDSFDLNITLDGVANDGAVAGTGIDNFHQFETRSERDNVGSDIEIIIGSYGNDRLVGDGGKNTFYGAGGDDTLLGGGGNDWLDGGSGNDSLDGGAGNDLLRGDGTDLSFGDIHSNTDAPGNDVLFGGDGADTLFGAKGNDRLVGGAGYDRLHGDIGDDSLDGGAGNDWLWGEAGNDALSGGDGNDVLDGGPGKDRIDAGAGDDRASGGSGNDALFGRAGRDTLAGQAGDDTLFSGDDNVIDQLDGGPGTELAGQAGAQDLLSGIERRVS